MGAPDTQAQQPSRKLPSPPPSLEHFESRDLPNTLTNLTAAVPTPSPDLPEEGRVQWLTQLTTDQVALADAAALSNAAQTPPLVEEPVGPTVTSSSPAETPEEATTPAQENRSPNLAEVLAQLFQFRETYGSNVDALSLPFEDNAGSNANHAADLPQLNGASGGDSAPLSTPPGNAAPETVTPSSPSADAAQPGQQLENDAEAESAAASAAGPSPQGAAQGPMQSVPLAPPAVAPLTNAAVTPPSAASAPSPISVVMASARGNLTSSPDPTFPFVAGVSASYQLATFNDPIYVAPASWHETIAWGDGSQDNYNGESGATGTFAVQGTHTYNAAGSYDLQVTFADANGRLSVANTAAVSPSIGNQTNMIGDSVALTDAPTSDGAGLTYSAAGLPPGIALDANTGSLTGTIGDNAVDNSPYTTTLTTTSAEGNSTSQTFTYAGVNPGGGTSVATTIGGPNHGLPKPACTSCEWVLNFFGISDGA